MVLTTSMSFLRAVKRKLKDGTERSYWCRVEGYREGGKVRQRMVEYVGINPLARTIPLDPVLARKVAGVMTTGDPTPTEIWHRLQALDLRLPGRPRQVSLTYTPPLRRYTLHCE